jgi:hypothetical protein
MSLESLKAEFRVNNPRKILVVVACAAVFGVAFFAIVF